MNKTIWTKVLATLLVFTLTCANFILLGIYAGNSYAISDELENQTTQTNNVNVEFDAYFKDEKGNKVHTAKESINKDNMKLYLSIEVKKGYLKDAKVQVFGKNNTSSNLKVMNGNQTSEMIEKIDSNQNIILLKQINSGTKLVLEIPVASRKDDKFDLNNLSKANQVNLLGNYIGDSGKAVSIDKAIEIRNEWIETATPVLEQQVLRFIPYQVNGQTGTIVQTLIRTGLDQNVLPIESTNLIIEVPSINGKLPKDVKVTSNGTYASNGKDGLSFTDDQYTYNAENGRLSIDVKNEVNELGQVSWNKIGKDEYVVTYLFEEKLEYIQAMQTVKASMKVYNSVETKVETVGQLEIACTEKLGEIVTTDISATEQLSKGNLYAKTDRETIYQQNITVDVSYINLVDGIALIQRMDHFVNEQEEMSPTTISNMNYIHYKTTKISKVNFEKILGVQGVIKILSLSGEELAILDKDTPTDENGDYTFTYEKEMNEIQIVTSKPVQNGKLEIRHEKALKGKTDYSKSQIATFKTLKLNAKVEAYAGEMKISEVENTKEILLVDPTTKIEASVNVESLSTVVKNENVEFRVILKNNDITCDLYKNPIVEIVLPNYIKELNIKDINLLFDDQLTIKNYQTYVNENGSIVIKININGEQTKYNTDEISKGANLVINTDVTLKQLTPTKTETMKVYVTNENATSYEQTEQTRTRSVQTKGYAQTSLRAVAPVGMVTTNTITGYNSKNENITSISTQAQIGKLEVKKEARAANVHMNIINNYTNKVNNISILGRIPTVGNKDVGTNEDLGSNMSLNLANALQVSGVDPSKVTIYYSANVDATKDLSNTANGWTTAIDNFVNVKSYLIVLNNYEANTGDSLEVSYSVHIPENLSYHMQAYANYAVYYNNVAQEGTTAENAVATKVGLATGDGPELEINISSSIENGKTVEEGQIIKYTVSVKNIGKTALQNVTISGNVPEKTIYTYYDGQEGTQDEVIQLYDASKKEYSEVVQNLEIGETKTIEYLVEVQNLKMITQPKTDENGKVMLNPDGTMILEKVPEDVTLSAIGKATVQGFDTLFQSNEIKNKVVQGYINVKIDVAQIPASYPRSEGDIVTYQITVKNANSIEKENVVLTNAIPEGLTFKEATKEGKYDPNNRTVTWNIGNLGSLQERMFLLIATVDKLPNDQLQRSISNQVIVKTSEKEVSSNEATIKVQKPGLIVTQTSDTKSTVSVGDTIVYNITIRNAGTGTARNIKITDVIPDGVRYDSVQYSIEGKSEEAKIGNGNAIIEIAGLNGGSTINLTIKVIAEKLASGTTKKEVTNVVKVEAEGISEILSNSITHTIVAKNSGDHDDPSVDVPEEGTYHIAGIAWVDSNQDGKRDDDEPRLPRIPVMLINAENGQIVTDSKTGKEKKQETNDQGEYVFSNLKLGKYMVIFLYDSGNYGVTQYQKTGINDDKNSDIIAMNVTYEGKTRIAGVSNTIELKDENIGNIDMGLIVSPKFDLKLDKVISKITVSDSKGTKTHEYKDVKTAKLDLDPKTINGSTIMIEYKIRVTNEGGVAGYAKKIVDYMPKDMKFSSEINKDWYASDNGNIYNASLANTLIQPQQTKELTLLLTKKMTGDNTGIINNTAEIQEAYNDLGLEDIDSRPGNKVQTEDDISSADAAIGIKTGEIYIYITLIISIVGVLGVGIYLINKKVVKRI